MGMSGMDMSGMDMSGMDMSGGGGKSNSTNMTTTANGSMSSSMCMVMLNGFQFSMGNPDNCVLFLFPFSPVDTKGRYAAAIIGTFLLCIAFEFFRAGRERMIKMKAPFVFLKNHSELTIDTLKAGSYGIQVLIGYWLMLLVMLYEALIFIAIVAGITTGYFLVLRFNRMVDRREKQQALATAATASNNKCCDKPITTNDAESDEDRTYESPTPCCARP